MRGLKVVWGKEREEKGWNSFHRVIYYQSTYPPIVCMFDIWHPDYGFVTSSHNTTTCSSISSTVNHLHTYIGVYIRLLSPVTPTCHRMKRWTVNHTSPPYTLANGRFVCYNFLHVTVIVIISQCRLVFVHHFPLYGSIMLVSKPYIKKMVVWFLLCLLTQFLLVLIAMHVFPVCFLYLLFLSSTCLSLLSNNQCQIGHVEIFENMPAQTDRRRG